MGWETNALSLGVVGLLWAGHAGAIVGGRDPRPEERAPYRSFVRLSLEESALCSGVHLGDGRILTARHCYSGERNFPRIRVSGVDGLAVIANAGNDYEVSSPEAVYREDVTTASGRTVEIAHPDIAVVTPRDRRERARLAALPVATLDLAAEPQRGTWLIAGFGNDHFGSEDTSGFAVGNGRFVRVDMLHWVGSFLREDGDAAPSHGDSGGPMFRMVSGVPRVFGIASTFRADTADVARFYYVRTSEERTREWLRAFLPPRVVTVFR